MERKKPSRVTLKSGTSSRKKDREGRTGKKRRGYHIDKSGRFKNPGEDKRGVRPVQSG